MVAGRRTVECLKKFLAQPEVDSLTAPICRAENRERWRQWSPISVRAVVGFAISTWGSAGYVSPAPNLSR